MTKADLNLNSMYATIPDFRDYVDKCSKTYKKSIDEVLELATTTEYALYLLNKNKDVIEGGIYVKTENEDRSC